jgi:hypothetical protein
MAITQITVVLEKTGAVFASEIEANANRFLGYSELFTQASDANKEMVDDGTLAEAMSRVWNQSAFTLTLVKRVTNMDNYNAVWGPIAPGVRAAETANGWVQVSETSVII